MRIVVSNTPFALDASNTFTSERRLIEIKEVIYIWEQEMYCLLIYKNIETTKSWSLVFS
jgi:hypothetical protein